MNIYTIYRATNIITGLHYIGFTSVGIQRRMNKHRRDAMNHGSQIKFHKAIRSYGWESFIWEVIYQAKEELPPKKSHTCKVMEDHFINEYDSINNGYNTAPGGGAWPILYGEDNPSFGKEWEWTCEQKLAVTGENHHAYGTKWSDESRNKRESKGYFWSGKKRPFANRVYDFDGDKNPNAKRVMTPAGEFASLKSASAGNGLSLRQLYIRLEKRPLEFYRVN